MHSKFMQVEIIHSNGSVCCIIIISLLSPHILKHLKESTHIYSKLFLELFGLSHFSLYVMNTHYDTSHMRTHAHTHTHKIHSVFIDYKLSGW
jgi:hypothetical protein